MTTTGSRADRAPAEPTLGLAAGSAGPAGERRVAVAVDAPGAGRRRFTYSVPDRLAGLEPGEAVLVEFGKRQALGIVLGPAPDARTDERAGAIEAKPITDRVRADGPILPPLGLALAERIAQTYLVPPAVVLRAMLPPGLLERLELVAERRPGAGGEPGSPAPGAPPLDAADGTLLDALADGPRAVRDLAAPEGRAGLTRRLRSLATRGLIDLDWTLLAASGGPRYERWALPTDAGRSASATLRTGERLPGRPLGPRQVALLAELDDGPATGLPAALLAGRHGTSALAGLVRRGLAAVETRERPRRPLAHRPAGRRGGRPSATELTGPQAEAVGIIATALATRDPTPLLLDGVTGGGKTAVYAEAIAACLDAGRPALVLVPEIALAMPLVDRLRADLDARVALVHSARRCGGADRRVAPDPGRRRGSRRRHPAGRPRPARRRRAGHRRRGARSDVQERPDAPAPGPRRGDRARPPRRSGRRPRERHAGRRHVRPGARRDVSPGRPARTDRPGRRRRSRSSTCGPSSRRATAA